MQGCAYYTEFSAMKNLIGFIAIIILSGLAVLSFGQTFGNGLAGCLTNPGNNGTEYPKDAQTDITVDGLGGYYAAVEDCAVFHISNNGTVDTVSTDGSYTQIDMQGSNFYGYNKATTDIDQFTDDGSGGYTITPLITTNDFGVKDISIRDDGSVDRIRADGTYTNSASGDFTLPGSVDDMVFTDGFLGGDRATYFTSTQSNDIYKLSHSTNTVTVAATLSSNGKNITYRYDPNTFATNPVITLDNNSIVEIFQGAESQIGTVSPGSHSIDIDPNIPGTLFDADLMFVQPVPLQTSTLPVTYLENLDAARENGKTILTWATAQESNSDFFVVERKVKGQVNFTEIGRVKASGQSSSPQSYIMVDETVPLNGQYEYRLRQVDLNGQFEYSNIATVTVDDLDIKIYPNPAHQYLNINGREIKSVFMIDWSGQIIKKFYNDAMNENLQLDVTDIAPGVYTARFETMNSTIHKRLVVASQ